MSSTVIAYPSLCPEAPDPAQLRSTTATSSAGSACLRKYAVHRPVYPPPTTHTSARSIPRSGGPGVTGSVSHQKMLFRSPRKAAPSVSATLNAPKVDSLRSRARMASRKEEKERLRQQRIAAERRDAQAGQRRLLLGYVVAGLLAAAVVVGIVVVLASGGGDGGGEEVAESAENAHIDPTSGVPAADPDDREGTAPPAVEQARLEQAAEA